MIDFIMSICDHSGNRVVFVMRIFSRSRGYCTLRTRARGGRPEALGNVNNPTSRIRGRVESYHLGGKAGLFSLYGGSRSVSVGVMT